MIKYIQCIFCYLFVCATAVAQPTFTIESVTAVPGDFLTVRVSAEDLVNIVSMQFSIDWDPTVVEFQQVGEFGIPSLGPGNFGAQDVSEGRIGMNWFDMSQASLGFTAEQIDLFNIIFRAPGGIIQAETAISFSGLPVAIEIADTSFMDIGMIPVNGVINVLDPNDVDEENTGTAIGQNIPNPFIDFTYIPVEVSESNDIKIEILNLTGALIYKHTEFIHPGLHKINIPGDIFPTNGTYLYSVLIGEKKVAKKLFYNGK